MEPNPLILSPRQELTDDLTAMPPDSGEFRRTGRGPSGPILNTKRTLADFYEHSFGTLENCYRCKPILGSNPSPSATCPPPPLQSAIAIQPGAGRIRRPDSTMARTVSAGIGQLNQPRMSDSGVTTAARTAASKSAA